MTDIEMSLVGSGSPLCVELITWLRGIVKVQDLIHVFTSPFRIKGEAPLYNQCLSLSLYIYSFKCVCALLTCFISWCYQFYYAEWVESRSLQVHDVNDDLEEQEVDKSVNSLYHFHWIVGLILTHLWIYSPSHYSNLYIPDHVLACHKTRPRSLLLCVSRDVPSYSIKMILQAVNKDLPGNGEYSRRWYRLPYS